MTTNHILTVRWQRGLTDKYFDIEDAWELGDILYRRDVHGTTIGIETNGQVSSWTLEREKPHELLARRARLDEYHLRRWLDDLDLVIISRSRLYELHDLERQRETAEEVERIAERFFS